jgi:hypothetical protein
MALSQRRLLKAWVICGALALQTFALMFCAGCSHSKLGKAFNVGVGVSSTADFVTTRFALNRGGREGNPIIGTGAFRQAVIKAAGVSGVIGAAWLLETKERRVLAHLVRAVVIAGYTFAAVHNRRVGR